MLGPVLAFTWFFDSNRKTWITVPCILVLALFGFRSVLQIKHWENTFSLYEHAIKVNPNSAVIHYSLLSSLVAAALCASCHEEPVLSKILQSLRSFRITRQRAENEKGKNKFWKRKLFMLIFISYHLL